MLGKAAYLDTDPQAMNDMFDIHVTGPMRVTQGFASMLIKTANSPGDTHRKTTIINTGSVVSHGLPWHTAYSATKVGALPNGLTSGRAAGLERLASSRNGSFRRPSDHTGAR